MYADGAGLRYIAQRLTDDGVPSASQYDPARNRHRDPRGWSHSAIRAILDNPTYRGVRVWASRRRTRFWSTLTMSLRGMRHVCGGVMRQIGSRPSAARMKR